MKGQVKSADGVPIAYQVEGSGNPALVFVHGWCCDKGYWEPQVSHFAQKHKVVAIDLAGHGESGLDRDRWTVSAFGEDVASVVNYLAPEQAVLIGHSLMGAAVILEAAQRILGVLGIVGVDQPHPDYKADPASLDRLTALRTSPDEVVRDAARKLISNMFIEKSDPALVERITSDMSSEPPRIIIGVLEGMVRYDLGQAMEEVAVPVRCIRADRRPFDLEAARRRCPSFEVMSMSGVGHFVMLEDPATFNRLLEGIIQKLVSR